MIAGARTRARAGRLNPLDLTVEDPFHLVAGWPLSGDEIREVAATIGCQTKALQTAPAAPLAVWRRLGGPIPRITRSLDVRLVAGLLDSNLYGIVEYIDPAAWVTRDGELPFVYGAKHSLDSSKITRKGGVRTATFIGEDPSNADQIAERFVAQCIEDFCTNYARIRLQKVHGYECLQLAHNGPSRSARLPEHNWCGGNCDLCEDEFLPDGNRHVSTTWRRLFHCAERFLSQWELVRIDVPAVWDAPRVGPCELEGWPLPVDWCTP
jgi:hypothetical protein